MDRGPRRFIAIGCRPEVGSPTGMRGKLATHADESSHAGARLLVPMVMDQVREALETPSIVVGVPTRDVLIARSVIDDLERGPDSRSRALFSDSAAGLRALIRFELSQHGR